MPKFLPVYSANNWKVWHAQLFLAAPRFAWNLWQAGVFIVNCIGEWNGVTLIQRVEKKLKREQNGREGQISYRHGWGSLLRRVAVLLH